jgi:hypothetical protein
MTDSSYVWQDRYDDAVVAAHSEAGSPSKLTKTAEGGSPINGAGGPSAAASLLTMAVDYAKFVIAVMNGTGLKKETALLMVTPQSAVDAGCVNCLGKPVGKQSDTISWGLGLGSRAILRRTGVLARRRQRRYQSLHDRVGRIQARRRDPDQQHQRDDDHTGHRPRGDG